MKLKEKKRKKKHEYEYRFKKKFYHLHLRTQFLSVIFSKKFRLEALSAIFPINSSNFLLFFFFFSEKEKINNNKNILERDSVENEIFCLNNYTP